MKKLLLVLSLIIMTSTVCFAEQNVGFQDGGASKTTISKALKMNDNSYVTIQGNLLKRISDDKYLFKDATGTITVEIDDEKWMGQAVNTKDTLELTGEIEKKINSIILEVESVTKVIKDTKYKK